MEDKLNILNLKQKFTQTSKKFKIFNYDGNILDSLINILMVYKNYRPATLIQYASFMEENKYKYHINILELFIENNFNNSIKSFVIDKGLLIYNENNEIIKKHLTYRTNHKQLGKLLGYFDPMNLYKISLRNYTIEYTVENINIQSELCRDLPSDEEIYEKKKNYTEVTNLLNLPEVNVIIRKRNIWDFFEDYLCFINLKYENSSKWNKTNKEDLKQKIIDNKYTIIWNCERLRKLYLQSLNTNFVNEIQKNLKIPLNGIKYHYNWLDLISIIEEILNKINDIDDENPHTVDPIIKLYENYGYFFEIIQNWIQNWETIIKFKIKKDI